MADAKVDLIKYHINGNAKDMTPDIYGALVDEAKKRGYVTTVHIFNLRDAKGVIEKERTHSSIPYVTRMSIRS